MRAWPMSIVAVSLLMSLPAAAQPPGYYVEEDGIVTWLENADPHTVRPAEWQVRLYPRGQNAGETNYWTVISGKSSEDVTSRLQEYQTLELRHRPQPGDRSGSTAQTFFNAVGPIAM